MSDSKQETGGSAQLTPETVVVAADRNASCDLSGEAVILNLDSGIYYGLNPVGARTWELLGEETTVAAIRDILTREYEVEAERCLADLLRILAELRQAGLVEIRHEARP